MLRYVNRKRSKNGYLLSIEGRHIEANSEPILDRSHHFEDPERIDYAREEEIEIILNFPRNQADAMNRISIFCQEELPDLFCRDLGHETLSTVAS